MSPRRSGRSAEKSFGLNRLDVSSTTPLVVSYGAGGDSTVMLVRLAQRAIRPDLILFADTESERDETTSKAGSRKSIPPKSPVLATTSNIAGSALTAFSPKIASERHTPLTRLRPQSLFAKVEG